MAFCLICQLPASENQYNFQSPQSVRPASRNMNCSVKFFLCRYCAESYFCPILTSMMIIWSLPNRKIIYQQEYIVLLAMNDVDTFRTRLPLAWSVVMRALYVIRKLASSISHDFYAVAATSIFPKMDELIPPSAFCLWQRTCRLRWKTCCFHINVSFTCCELEIHFTNTDNGLKGQKTSLLGVEKAVSENTLGVFDEWPQIKC